MDNKKDNKDQGKKDTPKKKSCRVCGMIKKISPWFITGIVFALLCFLAINALIEPFSTNEYCGENCHEMDTAYSTWQKSTHGHNAYGIEIDCIECHLPPRDKWFTHLFAKAKTGGKDAFMHYFGGEYDQPAIQEKTAAHFSDATCLHCHEKLVENAETDEAKEIHGLSLNPPADEDPADWKCLACHEDAGHSR